MSENGRKQRKELAAGKQVSFTLTEDDVKVINKYKAYLEKEFVVARISNNDVARALMTRAVRDFDL